MWGVFGGGAGVKPYYDNAGITIYHGDCREVLPALVSRVNLVLTDPPYGIDFAAQPTKWQRRAGRAPETWDGRPIDNLHAIVNRAPVQIVWGWQLLRAAAVSWVARMV